MDRDGGQSILSFLVGLVMGGLIGAAVALLYAPQSGEETREAIRTRSIELREQATEQATQLREAAMQRIESLQAEVSELQNKLQEGVAAKTGQGGTTKAE
jgi:gas vesicle protein